MADNFSFKPFETILPQWQAHSQKKEQVRCNEDAMKMWITKGKQLF